MSEQMTAALFIFGVVWVLVGLGLGVRYITSAEDVPEMSTLQLGAFLLMSAVVGFPFIVSAAVTILGVIVYGLFKYNQKKGDR